MAAAFSRAAAFAPPDVAAQFDGTVAFELVTSPRLVSPPLLTMLPLLKSFALAEFFIWPRLVKPRSTPPPVVPLDLAALLMKLASLIISPFGLRVLRNGKGQMGGAGVQGRGAGRAYRVNQGALVEISRVLIVDDTGSGHDHDVLVVND